MAKAQAVILIILLIIVVVVGAIFFLKQPSEPVVETKQTSIINVEDSESPESTPTIPTPSEPESTQQTKEFDIIARQWDFDPSTITVNQGDNVILNIKSIDVSHGIAIPTFGISKRLNPGTETKIEFVADKKGTFTFFCNVQCGAGHSSMNGKLIVE